MCRILFLSMLLSCVPRGHGSEFQHVTLHRATQGNYTELVSFALEVKKSASLIKCTASCLTNINCVSLIFDSDSKQCSLLSKGISLDASSKSFLTPNLEAYTQVIPKCSAGYKESVLLSDTCFKANYIKKSKHDAEKECARENGFLVQIDSVAKHFGVIQFMQSLPGSAVSMFFIDGSDEITEDDWRLSDGRALHIQWHTNEPDPCCKLFEDCMIIIGNGNNNDVPCSAEIDFLCEQRYNII